MRLSQKKKWFWRFPLHRLILSFSVQSPHNENINLQNFRLPILIGFYAKMSWKFIFFYYFQNRTKNTGFPRVRKNNGLGKKENLQSLKTFLPDTGWNETAALWKNPIEFHTFKKPNPRHDFCEKYLIIKFRFCFILQLMHEGPCHVIFNTAVWFLLLWIISG